MVLCSETIRPLTLVRCYPIGVISMLDNGRRDDKIIAIPFEDPNYNCYKDISEIPQHIYNEMGHFFRVYKELEGKETLVNEVAGAERAKEIIREALDGYIENYCK